jgi:hypothetical protein
MGQEPAYRLQRRRSVTTRCGLLLALPGESLKGHQERFPSTRVNVGCGFRKETIAGVRRNGRDAFGVRVRGEASLFVLSFGRRACWVPKVGAARNTVVKPSEAQNKYTFCPMNPVSIAGGALNRSPRG